jgi:brefeldin A-inhibited guanine nucleotide-exchange protein
MADTEAPPKPQEVVEKSDDAEEHTGSTESSSEEEDSNANTGSEQASEVADERAPPAPQAPQEHNEMPPPPTPSTPTLNVPNGSDAPRTSEQIFDHRTSVNRPRTDSQSTVATTATRGSTRSSLVFVIAALETISASKDARKNKKLGDATSAALAAIKAEGDPARINPEILFSPLQLASEAPNVPVSITALDCIGKLISYSYFSVPAEPQADNTEAPPLIERAIDTICDCFQGEASSSKLSSHCWRLS